MRFSEASRLALTEMGINYQNFEAALISEFPGSIHLFDEVMSTFFGRDGDSYTAKEFYLHMKRHPNINSDSLLCNKVYDLYNYLRLYADGGRFSLFKYRQAEWDGPRVVLRKCDVPQSDVGGLPNFFVIYRGMSVEEAGSSCFGQSWSLCLEVARRFAFEHYQDKEPGVVASGILSKESVIHYEIEDDEQEIITSVGSVKRVKVLEREGPNNGDDTCEE